jgi:hypothetical protein
MGYAVVAPFFVSAANKGLDRFLYRIPVVVKPPADKYSESFFFRYVPHKIQTISEKTEKHSTY